MAKAKAKAGVRSRRRGTSPVGSSFDNWLKEEGILDEVRTATAKAVLAWQLAREMKRQKVTKTALAKKLGTSRTEIYRVLDPQNETVSLGTLKRAAAALGKRLRFDLVDAA